MQTYTYHWQRDGAGIPDAGGPTYTLTALDRGSTITCQVVCTEAGRSTAAVSRPTTPIGAEGTYSETYLAGY